MSIATLRLANFRNFKELDLFLSQQGLNLIYGKNGSGKTSLLEAIYYLGSGRSFRTTSLGRLIQHENEKFSIYSQICQESGCLIPVGAERERNGQSRIRIAGQDVNSLTQLASLFPIRLINSASHQLIESGPLYRRKYLDWGLFYQSEQFFSCWRHFDRVLKQRNASLRDKRPKNEVGVWTEELIKFGLELDAFRTEYVKQLEPLVQSLVEQLLGFSNIQLQYQSGWPKNESYPTALSQVYWEEMRSGYTLMGPHRADLDLLINGVLVKQFLSRGQQKLLICAMILAQGMLLNRYGNKGLIYLVDDLPSELDAINCQKLLHLFAEQKTQVFITAIEGDSIVELNKAIPTKVFHVEHAKVIEQTGTFLQEAM